MNQEMKRRVTACAAGFSLPRYRELPSVGLYLDQTVQLVNSCFRGFPGVELTPSMVSNYVKKGVISHPVKKKYSREQLASLIYIVLSKNVLSLENIDTLFQMQRAHCTAAEAYDYFCDEVENCLPYIFGASRTICDLDPDAADEKRLLRGTIVAAVNKTSTAASSPCGRRRRSGRGYSATSNKKKNVCTSKRSTDVFIML